MGWEKSVLAVCLAALVLLPFTSAENVVDAGSGGAIVCYKDYFGKESCVSASKVKWQGGGFVITDNAGIAEIQAAAEEKGASNQVSVVYYGDLQNPGIAAIGSLVQRLKKDYGEDVSVEFLQKPEIGRVLFAQEVAEASECTRGQGKLEEFKQKIFDAKGQEQDKCTLEKHAFETGLDLEKFKACISSGEKKAVLEKHKEKIASLNAPAWSAVAINGLPLLDLYEYDAYTEVVEGILTNTPYDIRRPTEYSDQNPLPFPWRDPPQAKHTPVVEKAVADAIDFYDEQGKPEERLYLKVYLVPSELKTDSDFQKLQEIVEGERSGAIESIDRNNKILYVSMPASSIDPFSAVDKVEKISFDEKHAVPSTPPKTLQCPVLDDQPSTTPNAETSSKEEAVETTPAERSEGPAEADEPASVKALEIKLSLGADKTAVVSSNAGIARIESKGVNAVVANPASISFDDEGLNLGGRPVKIFPDEAASKISSGEGIVEIQEMKLQNVLFNPVYEVSGEKSGKILGLVAVNYPVKMVVNAADGTIESTQKPWWSFLAG